ncbi:MAG: Rieske 2Fe-2S domain-containing protein [Eubacteriales bacterium]|nr:Rieske 2Fe-2S domain-containing protein [Eubacteriales bacterium]
MQYVKLATVGEVKHGEKKKILINDKAILLLNVGGLYYAFDNRCPHMGGLLSGGDLEGTTLTCPRHGAKFDVRTGKSVGNAKLAFISVKVGDATKLPLKVEGTDILVGLD